jgi:Aldehyde dehydrogenase family
LALAKGVSGAPAACVRIRRSSSFGARPTRRPGPRRRRHRRHALHPPEPVQHSRIAPVLHADIFDSFLDKLRSKTQAPKLGDPLDEATDISSIINEKQFRKVLRLCG